MKTVSTLAAALSLAVCFQEAQAAQSIEIAMCPEPVRISDCKLDGGFHPKCIIENTTQRTLSGYPKFWVYDKDGLQIDKTGVTEIDGMLPGQKKRVELVLGFEHAKASKAIVCSIDPESPAVRGQIRSVGVAR